MRKMKETLMRLWMMVGVMSAMVAGVEACPYDMGAMKHSGHEGHGGHVMAPAKGVQGPVMDALEAANAKMHKDMSITYTGDADIDMLRGMIPHHQGAVEMAQVVMQYGNDPQVRRMAAEIIRNQNLEIRWMQNYLAQLEARGARPVAAGTAPKAKLHDTAWMGGSWLGER